MHEDSTEKKERKERKENYFEYEQVQHFLQPFLKHFDLHRKGVQELQKLHGVGNFFNGWWLDPPPPLPPQKRKY